MKHIKPGRGPSGMAFIGSIGAAVFGVFWTVTALTITRDAPGGIGIFFPLFGVFFIVMAVVQAVYHLRNASGRNRYSMMDITDDNDEGDPSDTWVRDGHDAGPKTVGTHRGGSYCPYCGAAAEQDYRFCRSCGKEIK